MNEAPAADRLPLTVRHSVLQPLLAVFAVFILFRIGYFIAGVRFDASPLTWYWQFIDPALLRAHLGQSLWYLHSQPPAFNLFLGIVLKLFPGHELAAFVACYLLLGLVFAAAMLLLLRGFGVPDVLSAVAVAIYVASPTFVLFENWLFYTYPVTVLLLLAALFWQRFVWRRRYLDALLLFICAALLALTWSLFHLVWLLALVLALVLLQRRDWRKVLAAAAIPLLVVAFWYGKNLVQFGQFTGSTWFGMSLSKMTNCALTGPERQALYASGVISPGSFIQPFSSPDRYYGDAPKPLPTGIPVLDQELKPSGAPNYNNVVFVAVSRQYGRDALRILAAYPSAYLRTVVISYLRCFRPASSDPVLARNAAHVSTLIRLEEIVFDGRFSYHRQPAADPVIHFQQCLSETGWFIAIAYALAFAIGLVLLLRPALRAQRSSLFFLWFNAVWVVIAANAVEIGENDRFRFAADPLVFALLVAVAVALVRNLRSRRGMPASRGPA